MDIVDVDLDESSLSVCLLRPSLPIDESTCPVLQTFYLITCTYLHVTVLVQDWAGLTGSFNPKAAANIRLGKKVRANLGYFVR